MSISKNQWELFKQVLRGLFIVLCVSAIVVAYALISKNVYGASAGSSFSYAAPLPSGTIVEGTLSGSDYYYKFTKSSARCKLSIAALSGLKTATLYDSNYSAIASCSHALGVPGTGITEFNHLLGGTYYIKVSGGYGGYMLSCMWFNTNETIAETQTNRHDSFADAASISLNKLYKGQLGYNDNADAFRFDIPHDGTITVSKFFVSGDGSPIKGQLYNAYGVPEGPSFLTAKGSDNVYSSSITKGTHYVVFSGGQGVYHYNLSYSENHVHSFGQWKTTQAATCIKGGMKERECSLCHTKENQVIHADHSWNKKYTVDKKATYAATGSKSIHCSICGARKSGSIVPVPKLKVKTPAVSKPKAIKKGFTLKWKKVSRINGYEIQYALNRKFTKSKKTVKVSKGAIVSKKITKLKAKKKYYIRVRAYKTVNGKKYYSSWGKTKTVTTKK